MPSAGSRSKGTPIDSKPDQTAWRSGSPHGVLARPAVIVSDRGPFKARAPNNDDTLSDIATNASSRGFITAVVERPPRNFRERTFQVNLFRGLVYQRASHKLNRHVRSQASLASRRTDQMPSRRSHDHFHPGLCSSSRVAAQMGRPS